MWGGSGLSPVIGHSGGVYPVIRSCSGLFPVIWGGGGVFLAVWGGRVSPVDRGCKGMPLVYCGIFGSILGLHPSGGSRPSLLH